MIAAVLKNIFLTAADLSKDSRLNHNHISPSAILRMLNKEGLKARAPKGFLQISDKNFKLRKEFAEQHSSWTHRGCGNVVFSDESWICAGMTSRS
jgi:hypothetical protein